MDAATISKLTVVECEEAWEVALIDINKKKAQRSDTGPCRSWFETYVERLAGKRGHLQAVLEVARAALVQAKASRMMHRNQEWKYGLVVENADMALVMFDMHYDVVMSSADRDG